MNLNDRTVLVTGASSGIGRETVKAVAKRGASVVAVARRQDRLDELASEVEGVTTIAADLAEERGRDEVVRQAGAVDVLVNNAGAGWLGLVEHMPFEEVRRLFEINVLALIDLTQKVMPGMIERQRGHVVMVSSQAAYNSAPPLTVYSSTKWAVQGFAEGLRREMTGRGVHVSTVNPGPVDTEFVVAAPGGDGPGVAKGFSAIAVPPWTVANAVVRAVERENLPGFSEISVPRVLGMSRLGGLPGVSRLIDLTTLPARIFAERLQGEGRAATAPEKGRRS